MKDNAINLIRVHEGVRETPYLCSAGKWTIGVGRNLEDRGLTLEEMLFIFKRQPLDRESIEHLFTNDLRVARDELLKNFPVFEHLSENRQGALVNMCLNLGWPRLSKFKKMFAALEAGEWGRAAAEALDSLWARQVGNRAVELARIIKEG